MIYQGIYDNQNYGNNWLTDFQDNDYHSDLHLPNYIDSEYVPKNYYWETEVKNGIRYNTLNHINKKKAAINEDVKDDSKSCCVICQESCPSLLLIIIIILLVLGIIFLLIRCYVLEETIRKPCHYEFCYKSKWNLWFSFFVNDYNWYWHISIGNGKLNCLILLSCKTLNYHQSSLQLINRLHSFLVSLLND